MRIAVDGRHLAAGRGVARYTRALLEALVAQFPDDDWRVFVPGREPVDAEQERGHFVHEVFEDFFAEWQGAGRGAVTLP